jgi:exopolyphosphatase/guanosine-5'-triphosphate,3'-diphosphate pyrophosphatase
MPPAISPRLGARIDSPFVPVGVVDIGSNSVRLVIYDRLSRAPNVLFNEKVLAGLGKGIAKTGRLTEAAIGVVFAALRRFRRIADQWNVGVLHVLATAAAREAENGEAFIAELALICRSPVRVLSGAEEAHFAALGVLAGFHRPDGVAGDLGGGSLELVDITESRIAAGHTFPLGGIRLSEAADFSIRRAERIAEETLRNAEALKGLTGRTFYAVGGTWRSLARLHMFQTGYPLLVMHAYQIGASEAFDFCRTVARGNVETLDRIEVVSKPRRDLLAFGAAVLAQIIRIGQPARVVVSALGLREGLLHDLLAPVERERDPLVVAAEDLAEHNARSLDCARELMPWTDRMFVALGVDETEDEIRLRHAACLLSDVHWRSHPDYRGEQSLSLNANGAFIGVDHAGRAFLALAAYYRHMGLIDDALSPRIRELAPTRLKERARLLGAGLRVAYLLSAARPGILPEIDVVRDGDRLVLAIPARLGDIDGEAVLRRFRQLAKAAGSDGVIQVG